MRAGERGARGRDASSAPSSRACDGGRTSQPRTIGRSTTRVEPPRRERGRTPRSAHRRASCRRSSSSPSARRRRCEHQGRCGDLGGHARGGVSSRIATRSERSRCPRSGRQCRASTRRKDHATLAEPAAPTSVEGLSPRSRSLHPPSLMPPHSRPRSRTILHRHLAHQGVFRASVGWGRRDASRSWHRGSSA